MRLRGIEFGNVLGASGVQGFFGEGYWFHYIPFRKPNFQGMTFVSKTATLLPRLGNVKKNRGVLDYLFPSWAKVKIFSGHTLNAMGLPNPGIEALLETEYWHNLTEPFFISIMSVENTREKRIEELRRMVDMIGEYKRDFLAPFGLQINMSCPNMGHDSSQLIEESAEVLDEGSKLSVPLMLKYAIDTAPVKAIMKLNSHPCCDAICVSNTIKFGWKGIDWKKVWGSNISPLARLDGGGLSGPALLPHVCQWITELRAAGFTKPINAGGGIFSKEDVKKYYDAGASSVFVGTVATYHPRRVAGIIWYANALTWRKT